MKLYSLTLNAIGPFAGQYHVDFGALGQSGLFLLEGPTGAGKSTIIDAIVFALYGGLAGESASKQRLMSQHAPAGARPFVDLTFEVESGIYRVVRTPAYQRPKKRGEGTTPQNETVKLTKLADVEQPDTGQVIATTTQEAGHEITGLIGLRKDQFLQTVVLPQGEFAKFLRSDGEQRKQLLESIFRTELYERITGALGQMRRDVKDVVTSAQAAVRDAAQVLASAADVEPDHIMVDDDIDRSVVDDLAARMSREAAEATAVADHARAERESASKREHDAAHAVTVARRYTELLAERDALLPQQASIEDLAGQVTVAQQAAAVAGAHVAMQRADAERQTCEAELAAALDQWGDDDPEAGVEQLTEQIGDLRRAREAEQQIDGLREQAEAARHTVAEVADELEQLDQRASSRPAQREQLAADRVAAAEQADLEMQATADLQAAKAAHTAAVRAADIARELATTQERLKDTAQAAQQAIDVHKSLRQRRIAGLAGELAQSLVAGEPCAVCGALEHPQPADRPDDHPDQEAIDAADEAARAAEATVHAISADLQVLQAQLDTQTKAAHGLSVEQAQAQHDQAADLLAAARQAADKIRQIDQKLAALDAQELDDERHRTAIASARATHEAQIQAIDERITQAREGVERALAGSSLPLVQELDRVQQRHRAASRVITARRDLVGATERATKASDAFTAALTEHGFNDEQEFLQAHMGQAELAEAQQRIAEFARRMAVLDAGLADADIAAIREQVLTDDDDPVLAAQTLERALAAHTQATQAVREATEAERQASASEVTTVNRAAKVANCVAALDAALAERDAVASQALPTLRVADIADGTSRANLKRLTLGTYVLMRRFEEVVAAANSRLGPMSSGRFMLRATDEKERGSRARKTGLALAVYDAHTGQERDPRTLSGGETFYVSLCLALGLADIVTAEAGGIWIETLFVDEGFGTLDPATLDAVMGQLGALSRAGRTVGIVSHVEELKQRVADRIEVRRLADGSSSLSVKAGA